MNRSFFRPFAHFHLDDTWVDSMAARRDHFLGNFQHQLAIPELKFLLALIDRDGGKTAAQNFQCSGERYAIWVDL